MPGGSRGPRRPARICWCCPGQHHRNFDRPAAAKFLAKCAYFQPGDSLCWGLTWRSPFCNCCRPMTIARVTAAFNLNLLAASIGSSMRISFLEQFEHLARFIRTPRSWKCDCGPGGNKPSQFHGIPDVHFSRENHLDREQSQVLPEEMFQIAGTQLFCKAQWMTRMPFRENLFGGIGWRRCISSLSTPRNSQASPSLPQDDSIDWLSLRSSGLPDC